MKGRKKDNQGKNFWQRHPGFDLYSLFWLVIFVILAAVGRFYYPLWFPAAVVLIYLLVRLLSKNQEKRQVENARFLALLQAIVRWFKKRKKTLQPDKEYVYFKCPTCGQPMRVPRGLGKVQITCRSCSSQFETKS